jgi:hypothetical protein
MKIGEIFSLGGHHGGGHGYGGGHYGGGHGYGGHGGYGHGYSHGGYYRNSYAVAITVATTAVESWGSILEEGTSLASFGGGSHSAPAG